MSDIPITGTASGHHTRTRITLWSRRLPASWAQDAQAQHGQTLADQAGQWWSPRCGRRRHLGKHPQERFRLCDPAE